MSKGNKVTKTHAQCAIPVVKRMGVLQTGKFIAEANILCDQITAGMKGLERPHEFESYEELILAILRLKSKEFSPYA